MGEAKLPLLELFTSLQKAGFPLGINDYQVLVESLARAEELGVEDRQALKRFCQALWVKSPQDKWRFEAHFERIIPEPGPNNPPPVAPGGTPLKRPKKYLVAILGGILLLGIGGLILGHRQTLFCQTANIPGLLSRFCRKEPPKPPNNNNNTQKNNNGNNNNPNNGNGNQSNNNGNNNNPQHKNGNNKDKGNKDNNELLREIILIVSFLGLGIGTIAGVRWLIAQRQKKKRNLVALSQKSQIIATLPAQLTTDYFPFTPRQMKQTWRYWRCLIRSGIPRELDIEATVRAVSRQGFLLQPVLLPRLINRTQLLLLMDFEGSMIPFHGLCHQLAKTALEGGGLHETMVYYFHNCPQGYLYKEPSCWQGIEIQTVLRQLQPQYAGVLIVSDGGAIRGNLNRQRSQATQKFLTQLRQYVRKISWLNPLPPKRWHQTTAMEIARQVPMFELNRQGLEGAIGVLRGMET